MLLKEIIFYPILFCLHMIFSVTVWSSSILVILYFKIMCGISGILKFTNKKIQKSEIYKSIISIQHRGPDSQNFWLDNDKKTLLINTRLAILDISKKGNQPLFSKDKRYIIVFNGEIYNFKELKEELLSDFFFYTNTDTEVLLNLFIKYKENCLEKLN